MKIKLQKRQIVGILLSLITCAMMIYLGLLAVFLNVPYSTLSYYFIFQFFIFMVPIGILMILSVVFCIGENKLKHLWVYPLCAFILIPSIFAGTWGIITNVQNAEMRKNANYGLVLEKLTDNENTTIYYKSNKDSGNGKSQEFLEFMKDINVGKEVPIDSFPRFSLLATTIEVKDDLDNKIVIYGSCHIMSSVKRTRKNNENEYYFDYRCYELAGGLAEFSKISNKALMCLGII